MVSDFVEEHRGYLRLTDTEFALAKKTYPGIQQSARQLLEYGAEEGHRTGDRFMEQIEQSTTKSSTRWFGCLIRAAATESLTTTLCWPKTFW